MTEWLLRNKKADFNAMSSKLGLSQTVCRVLANRGITDALQAEQYLHPEHAKLHEPSLLLHAKEAADRLLELIRENRRIRIIGDYDVDGIMSTFILFDSLTKMGAAVDYRIPDRITDGYGMNKQMVEEARESGIDVLLTCDNGISAIEPIALAKSYGMEVIVTDHHEPPINKKEDGTVETILPPADIIVNPKQPGESYPQPGICGAMVAFKVIQLLTDMRGCDRSNQRERLEIAAAFATVCDVMELVGENRTIVAKGLRMAKNCDICGVRALIAAYELEEKPLTAYHLGFLIGPCFNAAGRLETALLGLELLLENDPKAAETKAAYLKELNDKRKEMTVRATKEAEQMVERMLSEGDKQVLIVYLPECHESLAGIVAGRIREKYYRPTLVLTKGEKSLKGSGRSIEGYSMFEKLSEHKDLFLNFGGHPMAAGMSLNEENLEALDLALNADAGLSEEQLTPKLYLDAAVPFCHVTEQLVSELSLLEPFGNGNTKPVLATSNVTVCGIRRIGKQRNVIKAELADGNGDFAEGIMFSGADDLEQYISTEFGEKALEDLYRGKGTVKLTIAFSPDINEYKGMKTVQLNLQYYKKTVAKA